MKAALGAGSYAIGLIVICLILLFIFLVLRGMVWASDRLMPWLIIASWIALVVCILVFSPMSFFRWSRPWAGIAFYYTSYIFGTMLFAYSCLFVVFAWGYGALATGLILGGVGIVPVALLAAVFHKEWVVFWELIVSLALTFGTRGFGIYLITKAERAMDTDEMLTEYE